MGPLLVLVCSCFRENVNVTCKIVLFLCSLDNFLLKNAIVFFLEIKFQNGVHLNKGLIFNLIFPIIIIREKTQKFLQHISHLQTYSHFAHPIAFFFFFWPSQFCKKCEFIMYGFSLVWLLALILIRAILEQSINNKMVSKFEVGMSITDICLH